MTSKYPAIRRRKHGKLRAAMLEANMTRQNLAVATGLSPSTIDARMAGRVPWTITECHRIMRYLDLPLESMAEYFPPGGVA